MDFDSLIIADWPRGLYLAKELSAKGEKIAYLEITPYLKRPFPLFLDESQEKDFLESLGFLSHQEEGFCFLSSEGVWLPKERGQEKKQEREKGLPFKNPALNKSLLKEKLFSYLGQNLAGRIFEFNDSYFSEDSLPLFSDCFLFEPSFRKKEEFEKNYSQIHFFSKSLTDFDKNSFVNKESFTNSLGLSVKNIFCLSDKALSLALPDRAVFQWKACFFEVDLAGYESIIPEHFLGIKRLLFPWCCDNLMSVFQKKGILEVWMRLPINKPQNPAHPIKDPFFDKIEGEFIKKAQENLEGFFPGAAFQFKNQIPLNSFYVYGNEISPPPSSFASLWNFQDFFQASLAYDIKKEIQLSQTSEPSL